MRLLRSRRRAVALESAALQPFLASGVTIMAIKGAVAVAVVVLIGLMLFLRDGSSKGADPGDGVAGIEGISEIPASGDEASGASPDYS